MGNKDANLIFYLQPYTTYNSHTVVQCATNI